MNYQQYYESHAVIISKLWSHIATQFDAQYPGYVFTVLATTVIFDTNQQGWIYCINAVLSGNNIAYNTPYGLEVIASIQCNGYLDQSGKTRNEIIQAHAHQTFYDLINQSMLTNPLQTIH